MSSYAVRSLAGCRLLAVDLGPRYTGLAVRTSRLEGARPYGLLERVRRIAAEQPSVGVWLQPGERLIAHLLAASPRWRHTFGGTSLRDVRHHVRSSNDLQAGVIIVRASTCLPASPAALA